MRSCARTQNQYGVHVYFRCSRNNNICIVLQIDQCRYFTTVFTVLIRYEAEIDKLLMLYTHVPFKVYL